MRQGTTRYLGNRLISIVKVLPTSAGETGSQAAQENRYNPSCFPYPESSFPTLFKLRAKLFEDFPPRVSAIYVLMASQ